MGVERFRQSGQTVAQFCATEGVSQATFDVSKRSLADAPPAPPPTPTLVPIRLSPSPVPTAALELALLGGAVVRFPADLRPDVFVAVLDGWDARCHRDRVGESRLE